MNGWYFALQVVVAGGLQAAICRGKKYSFLLQIVSMMVAVGIYTFVLSDGGRGSNPLDKENFSPWIFYGITAAVAILLSLGARPLLRSEVKASPDKTDSSSEGSNGDGSKPGPVS